ncbi:hypothetical protein ACIBCN_18975 [Nocardia sp. NPDC051052]|uniref:hypothetical protein n=1 Tax=Nocardia sp. NPDC051052 TaxID=3364322 RepID=UPI0037B6E244
MSASPAAGDEYVTPLPDHANRPDSDSAAPIPIPVTPESLIAGQCIADPESKGVYLQTISFWLRSIK